MAMSEGHKEALAKGRAESRAIRRYLEAIQRRKPGRPVTAAGLEKRLSALQRQLEGEDDPLKRVDLIQRRMDTEDALREIKSQGDRKALEASFVKHARTYSLRKGITYSAWREQGVPASTLAAAGIRRTRRA